MPERTRRPRVALCAAITFDGKLDTRGPLPTALFQAFAPDAGAAWLIDSSMVGKLPPAWAHRTRTIGAGRADLARALEPLPGMEPVLRWLCPGGPKLFRALLDAGLVNDLYLLVRPGIDGWWRGPTLSGSPAPEFFPASIPCRLRQMEVHGDECFLRYTIARRVQRRPRSALRHAP